MKPVTQTVVYAALIGNVLVALTKAAAAIWTGSASMASEAVHSFVDSGNEVLMLYGMRRARQRADSDHPLGYGRELYFWSFIVALLVFAVGAGVSIYQGVAHLRHPEAIEHPLVNYIVLALAAVFEGGSWLVSWRQFRAVKGRLTVYESFRRSKDPPSFMVFFEDSAALLGIAIAACGTFAAVTFRQPLWDGLASILIGIVLAVIAILLARESKSLLIGEQADPGLRDSILRIVSSQPAVARANGVLTVQLSPDQILAALSVEFADDTTAAQIEEQVIELERQVRGTHKEVVSLFVKPQAQKTYRHIVRERYGEQDPAAQSD